MPVIGKFKFVITLVSFVGAGLLLGALLSRIGATTDNDSFENKSLATSDVQADAKIQFRNLPEPPSHRRTLIDLDKGYPATAADPFAERLSGELLPSPVSQESLESVTIKRLPSLVGESVPELSSKQNFSLANRSDSNDFRPTNNRSVVEASFTVPEIPDVLIGEIPPEPTIVGDVVDQVPLLSEPFAVEPAIVPVNQPVAQPVYICLLYTSPSPRDS